VFLEFATRAGAVLDNAVMTTQSPFSFLAGFFQNLPTPTPPAWAIDETHRRVVLMLNHVLMQEPQAMERLLRQSGRVILAQWRSFTFSLRVTPAGLFDLAGEGDTPDLTLVLTEESPFALAQTLIAGSKPPVRIEGDVQLAAEVNWLADNVRWDLEEDLSRIVGDAPSHMVMEAVRKLGGGLRDFLGRKASEPADPSPGNPA
jgi:ubiquinone biosynthesis protein UbiJ